MRKVMMVMAMMFLMGCGSKAASDLMAAEPVSPQPDSEGAITAFVAGGETLLAEKVVTGDQNLKHASVEIPKDAIAAPVQLKMFETKSLVAQIETTQLHSNIKEAGPALVIQGDATALKMPVIVNVPYRKTSGLSLTSEQLAVLLVYDNTVEIFFGSQLIVNAKTLGVQTMNFGVFQVVTYDLPLATSTFTTGANVDVQPIIVQEKIEQEAAAANNPEISSSSSSSSDDRRAASTSSTSSAEEEAPITLAELFSCTGSGLVRTISDDYMDDWGNTSSGDGLEIYCQAGKSRFCLSGEACMWRNGGTSGVNGAGNDITCDISGLGDESMASVTGWRGLTFFLTCTQGVAGTFDGYGNATTEVATTDEVTSGGGSEEEAQEEEESP